MQQYWNSSQAYKYMPVPVIAEAFKNFRVGQDTAARLAQGPDKAAMDKQSQGVELLVKKKYALSAGQLFAACWQVGRLLSLLELFYGAVVMNKFMCPNDTVMEQLYRVHCIAWHLKHAL